MATSPSKSPETRRWRGDGAAKKVAPRRGLGSNPGTNRIFWGSSMFSTRTIAFIGALVTGTATAAHAQEVDMGKPAPAPPPAGADEAFQKGTLGFAFPFTL